MCVCVLVCERKGRPFHIADDSGECVYKEWRMRVSEAERRMKVCVN